MPKKTKQPIEWSSWIDPKKMRVAPPRFMWPRYPALKDIRIEIVWASQDLVSDDRPPARVPFFRK